MMMDQKGDGAMWTDISDLNLEYHQLNASRAEGLNDERYVLKMNVLFKRGFKFLSSEDSNNYRDFLESLNNSKKAFERDLEESRHNGEAGD